MKVPPSSQSPRMQSIATWVLVASALLLCADMIWAESRVEGTDTLKVTSIEMIEIGTIDGVERGRAALELEGGLRPRPCTPEAAAKEFCLVRKLFASLEPGDSVTCEKAYRVGLLRKPFDSHRRNCKKVNHGAVE
jgi:hypothetical protein